MSAVVQARHITKTYGSEQATVTALDDVSLDIFAGHFTSIIGPSGCGKSTLLHCLAGLDSVDSGTIIVDGHTITTMNDQQLTQMRRNTIGFIFQSFNLVSTLDARKNIELPMKLAGHRPDPARTRDVAKLLGISDRLTHKPHELSGGQQQRVAIARTLVSDPAIIVADEPTGNLDTAASRDVLNLLRQAVDSMGRTVVMVTHDRHAAAITDRVLTMKDGRIIGDAIRPELKGQQAC